MSLSEVYCLTDHQDQIRALINVVGKNPKIFLLSKIMTLNVFIILTNYFDWLPLPYFNMYFLFNFFTYFIETFLELKFEINEVLNEVKHSYCPVIWTVLSLQLKFYTLLHFEFPY